MLQRLSLLCSLALLAPVVRAEKLTPARVFGDPSLAGKSARGVALSPDGQRVTYLRTKEDDAQVLDLWAADVAGGEPYRLIDARTLSSGSKELSEAEKARRERRRVTTRGVIEYFWDDEGRFILVPVDGDLFLFDVAAAKTRRLTETPGDEVDAKVSPKGRYVSYVRDQNLYVMEPATARETAVTKDGRDTLSFGVAEFIAQEEMHRFTGYWWSPDDARIIYARVDERGVDIVPRADIGAKGAIVVQQRYPRAGRPNAAVDLFVHDLATGKSAALDLGANKDIYVGRVHWAKDGKTIYVQRQSRDQRTLDLLAFDAKGGAGRVILTERSNAWVELTDDFRALAGGNFLWSSERSGNRHLYLYRGDGTLVHAVTRGDWLVDKVAGVDEKRGVVIFGASKDTPLERRLYEVAYAQPREPRALTPAGGWWTTTVAKSGGAFAGTYSDLRTPSQTALYNAEGKRVRWIEENRLDEKHPFWPYRDGLGAEEFGTLRASDGQTLHYVIKKPAGFDSAKKYPAIVSVYGGPHAQRVTRAWSGASDRVLTDAGYVVFTLDNRGSSNRSVAFQTALHRRLGTVEVEDQRAGAAFLKSLPYVDPARLGVMGWSYGGFMVLMLLTEENTPFAAGASGAPPTDWALYDTHYTEQFMDKPADNKDGYARSDVVTRLGRLKPGALLLLHGMADDNVIFENSTRLMAALQTKAIPFETMLYPGARHAAGGTRATGPHVLQTQLDFFARKLK
ncbi:MAG: S9 family peptidase [Verrucomicrobia bacterium]|nr:S9 family peptidase [Verrucomicrobiota bacterium]